MSNIQIIIKMQNPSQEPPVSSKAPNQDLKDMDDLWTSKIKKKEQKLGTSVYQRHVAISKSRVLCFYTFKLIFLLILLILIVKQTNYML